MYDVEFAEKHLACLEWKYFLSTLEIKGHVQLNKDNVF